MTPTQFHTKGFMLRKESMTWAKLPQDISAQGIQAGEKSDTRGQVRYLWLIHAGTRHLKPMLLRMY